METNSARDKDACITNEERRIFVIFSNLRCGKRRGNGVVFFCVLWEMIFEILNFLQFYRKESGENHDFFLLLALVLHD